MWLERSSSLEKFSRVKRHKFNRKVRPIVPVLASYGESYQQTMAYNSAIERQPICEIVARHVANC